VSAGPNLGLASTRELLEELRARGAVAKLTALDLHHYDDAQDIHLAADRLLRLLLPATLDYRTVDSR
jgi:hypothetical protein